MDTVNKLLSFITDQKELNRDQSADSIKNGNFLIVDDNGVILHKSSNFLFELKPDIKSLEELRSDPDINLILKGMNYNKTDQLSLEFFFFLMNDVDVNDYIIHINRITLLDTKFYLLLFEENNQYKVFENKINTLQQALEKGNIPVLIADDKYRTRYITNNFELILNKNIEDIYNLPINEILQRYLTETDEKNLLHALETKKLWSKVIKAAYREKGISYLDLRVTPLFDSSIRKWNYILSAYDITNYIVKNRILKRDEAKLRGIINNIADALFVIKEKKRTLTFEIGNDNFFELFNIDKKSLEKGALEAFVDPEVWLTVKESISLIEAGSIKQKTANFYYSATDKYFEMNITFVENNFDHERYYIITIRDITAKEKYEKQLESAYAKEKELNKLKTIILHNMSHELRTPANAITGYSDIIEDSIKSNDYDTISLISHSVKEILGKLISLFNKIIDLSSIESENYELNLVRINSNQVLRSVFNKKYGEAAGKKLELSLQINEENLFIKTDWIKFEKIISEIVDNAIKFTKKGRIKIESKLNKNCCAEFRVIDTGDGIEKNKIIKMLEPFEKEEEFYTRSYEGSGLGLTIVNKLVKILNGTLNIESDKNKGTIVTVTFPSVSPKPTIEL